MFGLGKNKNNQNNVLRAGVWFTICNIIQRGIQFLVIPIYTRVLSVEMYGRYSNFLTWINLIAVFATLSLSSGVFNNGMVKYEKDRDGFVASMMGLALMSSVLVAGIYFLSFPIIVHITGINFRNSLLLFIAIYFQMCIQLWTARQRYELKHKGVVKVTFILALLTPILGLTFFCTTKSENGMILGYVLANVLVGGTLAIVTIVRHKGVFNKEYWKFALMFNIPLIPHYLSNIILGQSDRVMIKYFCGDYYTGIYTLAYQISMVMSILYTGICNAITPWAYEKLKKNKHEDIKKYISTLIIAFAVMNVLITLVAPEIVKLIATDGYYAAIYVIPPVVYATFYTFIITLILIALFYYEKNQYVMRSTITGAVINVVLNVVFIKLVGYIAAAFTTVIGYMIILLVDYYYAQKLEHGETIRRMYNSKLIVYILIVTAVLQGLAMILYKWILVRWGIVIIVCFLLVIKRKPILAMIKKK